MLRQGIAQSISNDANYNSDYWNPDSVSTHSGLIRAIIPSPGNCYTDLAKTTHASAGNFVRVIETDYGDLQTPTDSRRPHLRFRNGKYCLEFSADNDDVLRLDGFSDEFAFFAAVCAEININSDPNGGVIGCFGTAGTDVVTNILGFSSGNFRYVDSAGGTNSGLLMGQTGFIQNQKFNDTIPTSSSLSNYRVVMNSEIRELNYGCELEGLRLGSQSNSVTTTSYIYALLVGSSRNYSQNALQWVDGYLLERFNINV